VIVRVGLIWAMAENGVIGRGGGLPWRLPDDLKHFQAVTMGAPVVMGRRTFVSLGRPLPGRRNLVLSRSGAPCEGAEVVADLDAALALAAAGGSDRAWVIGGASVYAAALPLADRLEVTRVHAAVEGDVSFPPVDWRPFTCVQREEHPADDRHAYAFTFERWLRTS